MTAPLTLAQLRQLAEAGSVDTVLACMVDMQGRLIGKRFQVEFFLDSAYEETHGCDYLLAGMLFWAWCLGAQPWAEDSALGVWFARILQTYETTHGPVKRAAIHLEENP